MIARYSRPEMSALWSDESRFQIWLEVETLALEKMVEEGLASEGALRAVREQGAFDPARVRAIEDEVKHDVIAFLTNVAEIVGPEARVLHRGMTSSDLLDTTFALQLKRAGEMILTGLDAARDAVRRRAEEFKYTPCIGRSHGIHAEPISFGVKLLSWYAELGRQRARLQHAIVDVAAGKISGAVGTYASVSPAVELHVMQKLGLSVDTVSSQVVSRDRHASFFVALAQLASSLERFALEVRHLQRTEVAEAEERFSAGQKGSSAMPHKRNPITSENLTGLARLVRSYAVPALENVALWHERDISHSSVERVIGPDACILTDFMLHRFKSLVEELVVHPDKMREHLESSRGVIFSGTLLLALVDAGVSREDAYRMVQAHALAAWEGGATLRERVLSDPKITAAVPAQKLGEVFEIKRHLRYVDLIFSRTLSEERRPD